VYTGELNGLYDPGHTPDSVFEDFLVFAKLAARRNVLPAVWSCWSGPHWFCV
jgi:hypothetical protein